MTLIKSISGIRGTIGGPVNNGLTPVDAVKFAAAYGTWLKEANPRQKLKVVIGRDARISGQMISNLVVSTLVGLGIDVIDLGLSTTPTVEIAVPMENAQGGIILTASHNPKQWNALKLLNQKGEFISGADGEKVLNIAEREAFDFAEVDDLGSITQDDTYLQKHIDAVLALPLVDKNAISNADFHVVVDAVNSTGGIFVPALLKALGVQKVTEMYCEPTGHFPHNPEPLPEHLTDLSAKIVESKADVGITVDPDVDRLALVCEDGTMFGEEYTLVAVADYLLSLKPGHAVSNLSSSRALHDVALRHGSTYSASAVGEVNVVDEMKRTNALVGGEGNGGIILPDLHYGRDALVGVALVLTHLAKSGMSAAQLRASYPPYFMAKKKIDLQAGMDVDAILERVKEKFASEKISTIDGVKIDFAEGWVHLRKSNTEPIVRIYTEAATQEAADVLGDKFKKIIADLASINA
jgi:phosphomannomutase